MTQPLMISAMGELAVARVPYSANETLQAFDQADVLALEYLQAEALLNTQSRVIMVNEPFGAITCAVTKAMVALNGSLPTLWSDSHIAHLGLQHNAYANQLPLAHFVPAQKTPLGPFDLVLFRLPKSHALLRDQLHRILPQLTPSALIIMPIMVKHMDKAVYQLLESLLGTVTTSLARKKARLVFAGNHGGINAGKNKDIIFDIYGMNNVQPIWGDDFLSKISNSSMGLNLSRGKPMKYYSSDRIAQLLGNGLLTFIDKKTVFDDFLTKEHVIFYNNIDDLTYKLSKYKRDVKERNRIAKNGRDFYLKEFNSTKVSEFILSKTFNYKTKNKFIWSR